VPTLRSPSGSWPVSTICFTIDHHKILFLQPIRASYLSRKESSERSRPVMLDTVRRGADRACRLARAAALSGASAKSLPADLATRLPEAIIEPGGRVTIEGDNQSRGIFLPLVREEVTCTSPS
jgi:hypothetical protein